jgi:hypothetical protein
VSAAVPAPLLILACGQRKYPAPEPLPAYRRYDGPAYRTLRAAGYPERLPTLRVLVLSAEYGLIPARTPIPDYDRRLDALRASELSAADPAMLHPLIDRPTQVLIWGGASYRNIVHHWQSRGLFADASGPIAHSSGGIGTQLRQLKRWLAALAYPIPG